MWQLSINNKMNVTHIYNFKCKLDICNTYSYNSMYLVLVHLAIRRRIVHTISRNAPHYQMAQVVDTEKERERERESEREREREREREEKPTLLMTYNGFVLFAEYRIGESLRMYVTFTFPLRHDTSRERIALNRERHLSIATIWHTH